MLNKLEAIHPLLPLIAGSTALLLVAVVAHFVARIAEVSVAHSCVYHGAKGCTLDRAERAPICNRWI